MRRFNYLNVTLAAVVINNSVSWVTGAPIATSSIYAVLFTQIRMPALINVWNCKNLFHQLRGYFNVRENQYNDILCTTVCKHLLNFYIHLSTGSITCIELQNWFPWKANVPTHTLPIVVHLYILNKSSKFVHTNTLLAVMVSAVSRLTGGHTLVGAYCVDALLLGLTLVGILCAFIYIYVYISSWYFVYNLLFWIEKPHICSILKFYHRLGWFDYNFYEIKVLIKFRWYMLYFVNHVTL